MFRSDCLEGCKAYYSTPHICIFDVLDISLKQEVEERQLYSKSLYNMLTDGTTLLFKLDESSTQWYY